MNNRTGRKMLALALVAGLGVAGVGLAAENTVPTSGSHGGHGGSSGHGGGGNGGGGNHGGYGGDHGGHGGGHYHGGYGGYGHGWYGGNGGWYGGFGGYGAFYGGWPYYGGGWYGAYPYYGGSYGYTRGYPVEGAPAGALDLDVSPEGAQIYVDGKLVGIADDFDGFPDYLWLPKGTYDVVIFSPGFETISRQYSIYGGLVIDVEDAMVPGKETMPEDLGSKSTARRDERLRRDQENQSEAQRYQQSGGPPEERREQLDARGEPGRIVLHVVPEDASVYLDGRFLGTGRELARLRAGLIVDPGEHRLEVVRPGRQADHESLTVRSGEEVRLDVDLKEE